MSNELPTHLNIHTQFRGTCNVINKCDCVSSLQLVIVEMLQADRCECKNHVQFKHECAVPLSTACLVAHLVACYLVQKYLQLIHTKVFIAVAIAAPPHFNVIAHFLVQCCSEPRTTAITAGAPICTPLWVPQRVIKVPPGFSSFSVPWLAKIALSHKWRCHAKVNNSTGTLVGISA